jgi:hypothetical protein
MKQQEREIKGKEKYQPNAAEAAALADHVRKRGKSTAPRIKVHETKSGTASVSIDHPHQGLGQALLMEAIGTVDQDFFFGLLLQLSNGSLRAGQVDERLLNFMLAVVKGIKPRDQVEIMLAAQMAAIQDAFMRATTTLARAEFVQQQDSAGRLLNNLARTFVTQMEALQRYRSGGEHKVTVQQVSVNDGGQAIVGNVTQATREPEREPSAKAPPLVPFQARPAMAMIDRDGERAPMPVERVRKAQVGQPKK